MRSSHRFVLAAALAAFTSHMPAQSAPPTDLAAHPDWPEANPADVATPLSTVRAFYAAISGPIGQQRDWTRVRSLFVPDGRIAFVAFAPKTDTTDIQFLNLDEYEKLVNGNFVKYGFYDRDLANRVERFGGMADVYSTYASSSTPDGKPFTRGIKSIELLHGNGRWYIVQIYWDTERPGVTLPEAYLHDGK